MEAIPVKPKVISFANKISLVKDNSKNAIQPHDPEYRILAPILTEEMAEVGLALQFQEPLNAEQIADRCGKPLEKTKELLWQLADVGGAFINTIDGVDQYWHDIWPPTKG